VVAAKWRAAHDGLTGHGYDLVRGRIDTTPSVLASLVEWVAPALEDLGELADVRQSLQRRFVEGNGAVRQRQADGLDALVAELAVAPVAVAAR
jgi:carboxylate-amine ligase